ncbi:glycoside hydrolase family 18 protein [Streptomyces mirabilis]|uniref:glycoside hydrolase family 18 protein n=1 Tax=Streptomyces mirabilis TaxID=68239 RepID=UPI00367478AC
MDEQRTGTEVDTEAEPVAETPATSAGAGTDRGAGGGERGPEDDEGRTSPSRVPAWLRTVGRGWRHPRLRWPKRVVLALVLVSVLSLLAAGTALRINYAGDPAPGTQTRNRDALWMGHAWVDGRKKDADVKALAKRLRATGIRDLYVHAGPLEHDGTLPESAYPKARWLVEAVHRELPGVRVQAWLGDVLATEGEVGMRLERAATRAAVVRSAGRILDAGFEGAHFDLEPLHSDDSNYLSLLDDLRRVTRAHDAQLSVAAHQIDPLPNLHSVFGAFTAHPKWWSQSFFGQVARRVDQIAVMSYDTALPLESLYGGYVAEQTSLALEVTPKSTDLLMGLPFYYEDNMDHHGSAETVAAAVRGTRLGLSRTDRTREHFGVALYVDFAAREKDWTAYEEGWVR